MSNSIIDNPALVLPCERVCAHPEQADENRKSFLAELGDSPRAFVASPDQLDEWTCQFAGFRSRVRLDAVHGVYAVDVNLAVISNEAFAEDLYALARNYSGFVYKIAQFWCEDDDGPCGWIEGAHIHMGAAHLIGEEGVDDAIRRVSSMSDDIQDKFAAVARGELNYVQAATKDDELAL